MLVRSIMQRGFDKIDTVIEYITTNIEDGLTSITLQDNLKD